MRPAPNAKYEIIWETIRQIPRGRVSTYGAIARISGFMGEARQVGYALRATPPGKQIPWHRVINSQGKISFPRTHSHFIRQKKLLAGEGIVFKGEKIDLHTYLWRP